MRRSGGTRRDATCDARGFTLIELLVVVIVIGVLAAIALPVFLGQRESAREAAAISDLRNVVGEMESAFARNSTYPGEDDVTLRPSRDVTLTIVRPPPTGTEYCVNAIHADLPDRVWYLDSSEGSVRQGSCTP